MPDDFQHELSRFIEAVRLAERIPPPPAHEFSAVAETLYRAARELARLGVGLPAADRATARAWMRRASQCLARQRVAPTDGVIPVYSRMIAWYRRKLRTPWRQVAFIHATFAWLRGRTL